MGAYSIIAHSSWPKSRSWKRDTLSITVGRNGLFRLSVTVSRNFPWLPYLKILGQTLDVVADKR